MSRHIRLTKQATAILIIVLVVLCSVIAAFRPMEAPDTEQYTKTFRESISIISQMRLDGLGDIFANRANDSIELGFIIYIATFRLLIDSLQAFFFFNSFATCLLIIFSLHLLYAFIIREEDLNDMQCDGRCNYLLVMFCFFMLSSGILFSSVAIRAGLALGLGLFGLANLLLGQHKMIASCALVLAILFHTTSLAFVGILLIIKFWKWLPSKKMLTILLVIAVIGYFLNFSQFTLGPIVMLIRSSLDALGVNAFSSYLTDLTFAVQKREGYLMVVWGICMLLGFSTNDNARKMFIVTLIGLFMYTFAYPIHALSRLVEFFLIVSIPACVYGYNRCVPYSRLLPCAALLLLYPQYVMVFSF